MLKGPALSLLLDLLEAEALTAPDVGVPTGPAGPTSVAA